MNSIIKKLKLSGFIALLAFIPWVPLFGQSCPACSNPAMQSSERNEAGFNNLEKGKLRLTVNITNGLNYQGGHPNKKGLTPEGETIQVPNHEHLVSLDFVRTEVALEYTFKENFSIWLRAPYDYKAQEASVLYPENVSETEREAILRNRDIHHRSEVYTGFYDTKLLFSRRLIGILHPKARLDIAVGSSIPVGKIENNPLLAGERGKKHLHIQFGSGTFDPLFELHYLLPLTEKIQLGVFSMNKLPFYQNRKTYRAPLESTTGVSSRYQLTNWFSLLGSVAGFTQSVAKWDGVTDPNSGLLALNGSAGMAVKLKSNLFLNSSYRFPVYQKTLSGEGENFEFGPTVLLSLSYSI